MCLVIAVVSFLVACKQHMLVAERCEPLDAAIETPVKFLFAVATSAGSVCINCEVEGEDDTQTKLYGSRRHK